MSNAVILESVSGASLGQMLKGYGVLSVVGEAHPDAEFWWTEGTHLAIGGVTRDEVVDAILEQLPDWAIQVGEHFGKARGVAGSESPLKSAGGQDELEEELAPWASAAAVFAKGETASNHPLFPGFGQDGSASYFGTLLSEAKKAANPNQAAKQRANLEIALFGGQSPPKSRLSKGGGLFFPEAIKRYATGGSWIHDNDSSLTAWDFLLAIRGALLLRGTARSFRGSRRSYPAFPFVFRGSTVIAGGKSFTTDEIFLPVWSEERPRGLSEFRLQIRQFQARVGGGELAASAADFRRAVQGRGVAGGFLEFHRFALERRKPSQREPSIQAISRGVTRVGAGAEDLRFLLAPLDETGWLDQLEGRGKPDDFLLAARRIQDAIHACADEPTAERHFDILRVLWAGNALLFRKGDANRVRPLPALPGKKWEEAMRELFNGSAEACIARGLASIGWEKPENVNENDEKKWAPWPLACQILPVEFADRSWIIPDEERKKLGLKLPWPGLQPELEFGRLFWRRWLAAGTREGCDRLPFDATRTVPLRDALDLVEGRLDLRRIHRCFSAFLTLNWSAGAITDDDATELPVPRPYAALRSWLERGMHPLPGEQPNWDGTIVQNLRRGSSAAIDAACRQALARLRIIGLPGGTEKDRRAGKAVACPALRCQPEQARKMAIAAFVPLHPDATEHLAQQFLIPAKQD